MDLKCCIISIYPFPVGLAPTNRIIAYSKGLIENGIQVDILITVPTKEHANKPSEGNTGIFEGIKYKHILGENKSISKAWRGILHFSGIRFFLGHLLAGIHLVKKSNRQDVIILSTDNIISLFFYSMVSKITRSKTIFIFDEYPIPIRHKLKSKIPGYKTFLYKRVLKQIHAYVSISNELKQFYNQLREKKTFILPIIVNTEKYPEKNELNKNDRDYICYMGNMELSKDNVDNIIKAFSYVKNDFESIDLFLFGTPKSETLSYLKELVNTLELNDRVFFKGTVSSDQVPAILVNATLLVSSQPNSLRAKGGFPTKLGEYLASGTPALLADVGENSKYVKDKEHLFFSIPDDPGSYAEKMSYILSNYDEAKRIARNGQEFIAANYSHDIIGKKFSEFIKEIIYEN